MTIKAIVFDQGGILIDVDYDKTIEAFQKLGATNAEQIYTQAEQRDYVDQFEQGKLDTKTFRSILRKNLAGLRDDVTDEQLDDAWNAMLLDFKRDRMQYVQDLKKSGCLTFMFCNIDEIHYRGVLEAVERDNVTDLFENGFYEKFCSHIFGANKPYAESFRKLAAVLNKKHGLKPDELLFIDDSAKHIYGREEHEDEGVLCAGWHGLLVKQNLTLDELKTEIDKKLVELGCYWDKEKTVMCN